MQTGNVASPLCLSTCGLLGAVSSFSAAHFAEPLPVCVAVQPAGAAPGLAASKLMVSASAFIEMARNGMSVIGLMVFYFAVLSRALFTALARSAAAPRPQ